jgi:hypothetical protein
MKEILDQRMAEMKENEESAYMPIVESSGDDD